MSNTTVSNMRSKRSGAAAAAVGSKIYVMGGYDGSSRLNTCEVYDTTTNAWTSIANMTTKRSCLAAAAVGSKIYAIGGGENGFSRLNTCEVFDTITNAWTSIASMNTKRHHFAAAAVGSKIYAIGGRDGSSDLNTCEVFDTFTNQPAAGSHTSTYVDPFTNQPAAGSIPIETSTFEEAAAAIRLLADGLLGTVIQADATLRSTVIDKHDPQAAERQMEAVTETAEKRDAAAQSLLAGLRSVDAMRDAIVSSLTQTFRVPTVDDLLTLFKSKDGPCAAAQSDLTEARNEFERLDQALCEVQLKIVPLQRPGKATNAVATAQLNKLREEESKLMVEAAEAQSALEAAMKAVRTEVHRLADKLAEIRLLHAEHFSYLEEGDIPKKIDLAPIYAIGNVEIYPLYLPKLGRTVCVKKQLITDATSKAVKREATVTAGLVSQCLLPILLHFQRDNKYYIVVPHYRLGDVAKMLELTAPTTHIEITSLPRRVREVLEALQMLHANGIVHGDIKPHNIFIDDDSSWVLGDFGSAKLINANTTAGTHTTRYAAPEVVGGAAKTTASDILSLGLTLFEVSCKCKNGLRATGSGAAWVAASTPGAFSYFIESTGVADVQLAGTYDRLGDFTDFLNQILRREPTERPDATALLHHPFVADSPQASARFATYRASLQSIGSPDDDDDATQLTVRRGEPVMPQCLVSLRNAPATRRLYVTFAGEQGVDAGGLTKELCTLLFVEARDTLFTSVAGSAAFHVIDDARLGPNGEEHLEFVGWLLMRALTSQAIGGALFPPFQCSFVICQFLFKVLLADSLQDQVAESFELAEIDRQLAQNVLDAVRDPSTQLRANYVSFEDGTPVTVANADRWARQQRLSTMMTQRRRGIEALRSGFQRNKDLLQLSRAFVASSPSLLQGVLCISFISPSNVVCKTTFRNFPADSRVQEWLSALLLSMNQENLGKWLRWATGGYSVQEVKVTHWAHGGAANAAWPLPSSHTCFNMVDMVNYPTEKMLRDKVLMAIEETQMATR